MRPASTITTTNPDAVRRATPLPLPLLAPLLYFVRFGYDSGTSDQDEVIPYLLYRLDPTLFAHDWFVQLQATEFGIRTYFVLLLEGLATVLPVWLAVLVFYLVVWIGLAAGVFALADAVLHDRLAAAAAVIAALVLTPQWTLGGNDLATSMLVPSMAAWALAVWALVLFLRNQAVGAGVLLGLATWLQALVGLQVALLIVLATGFAVLRRKGDLRRTLLFAFTFGLSALPALGPLVYGQLFASTPAMPADAPSIFYLMANFRAPHHYLPLAFPAQSYIRFVLLVTLGGMSLWWLHRQHVLRHASFVAGMLLAAGVVCAGAFVFIEIVPSTFVMKLQLFKTTVPTKLLLVIGLCGVATRWLPAGLYRFSESLLDRRWLGLAVVGALGIAVITLALPKGGPLHGRARPLARQSSHEGMLYEWVRANTPRDAVFAVPPSWSGFRSHAQRAIVVDFKAFPFVDAAIFDWFSRLMALAPIDLPERTTPMIQGRLDAAYAAQSPGDLLVLAEPFGVDFYVRTAPFAYVPDTLESVFTNDFGVVYRMRSAGPSAP